MSSVPPASPAQAALLAAPARRALMERLRSRPDSPTAALLADELSLHVTTVRFHLDQLREAGLVESVAEHSPHRGRPSLRYRAVDVDLDSSREHMIEALAWAATGSGTPAQNAREAGRRWAAATPVRPGSAHEVLTDTFHHLGFDPSPDHGVLRLRGCPFLAAARQTPQVVCQVHLGLARELAARSDDADAVRIDLIPFAEQDACHLRITRSAP